VLHRHVAYEPCEVFRTLAVADVLHEVLRTLDSRESCGEAWCRDTLFTSNEWWYYRYTVFDAALAEAGTPGDWEAKGLALTQTRMRRGWPWVSPVASVGTTMVKSNVSCGCNLCVQVLPK
jgi:hypothetical protein